MRFKIALQRSEEGIAVSVPALPGCWSQGRDEKEAVDNISEAIREYLSVAYAELEGAEILEIEIAV